MFALSDLIKLDVNQISAILRHKKQPESVIAAFVTHGVDGARLGRGISDTELEEMGVASQSQRRSVLALLVMTW